jgi:hypothetical protein
MSAALPNDATSVSAAYLGDADFAGSDGDAHRILPLITASISPAAGSGGWRRTPVTVRFTCANAVDCPDPVVLTGDGKGQSATGTAHGTNGGTATVTTTGIDIDRTKPVVSITGVRSGATYAGVSPGARCQARDVLSGVARCALVTRRNGARVTVTATATDRAGNVATASVSYTSPLVVLQGAKQRGGAWVVKSGKRYTLVVLSATAPRLLGPSKGKLKGAGKAMKAAGTVDGLRRWTITTRLTLPKKGVYKLGVRSGGATQILEVRR